VLTSGPVAAVAAIAAVSNDVVVPLRIQWHCVHCRQCCRPCCYKFLPVVPAGVVVV